MADVLFNQEDFNRYGDRRSSSSGSGLLKFFMRLTGIQDEAKANAGLLGVAVVCFLLAIIVAVVYL